MAAESLLPYINEKEPIQVPVEGLHVGGKPTAYSRTKARWSALSKPRKIAVGALIALAAFSIAGPIHHVFGHRHHHHAHFKPESKPVIQSAVYGGALAIDNYQTANASFALDKALTLFVPSGSRVIVQRGQNGITVESVWKDVRAQVEMSSTNRNDVLTIAEADDVTHTVHVFSDERPSLTVHSPKLSLDLGMAFERLAVHTEGDILLDVEAFELKLDTLGDISGKFEVAYDLMLHTVTGDIDAEISVVHHKFPKHHGKHHEDKHHQDKKHKHERKEKFHRQREGPEPPHGPPGPPPHGPPPRGTPGPPRHGPPRGPPGPPPFHHVAHVGAFSSTGKIDLKYTTNVSSVTHAATHVGNVSITHKAPFQGFFRANTHVGNLTIESERKIDIIHEFIGERGGLIEGFVPPADRKLLEHERGDAFDGPGGPGGPDGPSGPPGPPGPPHEPPKGFSDVFAHTDVGRVQLNL